ncbi:3D-(3,5/4)-trihydroxycyclohexane-1,2-dione acylhydrolase (decyclizing) [Rossellomorea sp. NS-SX7]|uniref:3D-(3,5/4)-trihydroxycyclohexane-1,2-dione acylhydrolase (decyclizing) n=1 Tax=Rossellomorea sp. NS-SX7 TaxID=3463856 RepID=UPI004057D524
MKTIRLTMAQALIKFLDQQYVEMDHSERKFFKGVFGIFGHGNVSGIGEALEHEHHELNFIQGKNEQGMVHAATAFAKQKNRLETYACTTSIGPGALNMVTAAGTATANRIPVLLLPGDSFSCRQPDPVLQQIENPMDYTISANDAFKAVSKYWDRITRPEQLMTAALNAMRVLTDPAETGAVTLCLPQDVQSEAYDYPIEFFQKRTHFLDRKPAPSTIIQRAVELIRSKKNPIIIAGGGVHYSFATEELVDFAERFHIPVAETQAGKSCLPWDHPLNVGAIGVTGSSSANRLAKEADLVIAIGTRLGDFSTSSKQAFQHAEVEVLSINVNAMDAMKMSGMSVVADAKEALSSLSNELIRVSYQSGHDTERISSLNVEWRHEVDRLFAEEHPEGLSQTRVIGELSKLLGEDSVIVGAAGSLPGDLHRIWRSHSPKDYHLEYGFSCMGYEVSGAFGVKLAEPAKEVYAMCGDGSFLMLHSELVTSIQEGKKINILLFDNHGYQCIHNLQRGQGSEGFGNEFRYRSDDTGHLTGQYMPINFASYAAALGVNTYSVSTIEELQMAISKAKEETTSTLIHMSVVPGTNTDGYDSWWRVDVAEVSKSDKVTKAHKQMKSSIELAKKY